MRRRIAQALIGLAIVLLIFDFVMILPRLAPYFLALVRERPEGLILAAALLSLIAARLLRRKLRTDPAGDNQ